MSQIKYRHEWKHEINYADTVTLRPRLSAVMERDAHTIAGAYRVRSLYFDDFADTALRKKIDGISIREKFRLRLYNGDTSFILLEKKSKINSLCLKEHCRITRENAQKIVNCDFGWLRHSDNELCRELYAKTLSQGLRPKTIVDYNREPFVFRPGNVRVTIDSDIRTAAFRTDFLNPATVTLPLLNNPIILEVKWDEYLPDIIKAAVTVPGRRVCAFSKYAQSRIYD